MKHLMFKTSYDSKSDDEVLSVFHRALDESGAHIRRAVEYRFHPQGMTAIVIVAESHAALHTWPELGFAMVDYFSCEEMPDFGAFEDHFLRAGFSIEDVEILER